MGISWVFVKISILFFIGFSLCQIELFFFPHYSILDPDPACACLVILNTSKYSQNCLIQWTAKSIVNTLISGKVKYKYMPPALWSTDVFLG